MSSPSGDGNWRRQAAIFAAAGSALLGLGILLILIFVWRDGEHSKAAPVPPTAESTR
jgi:hypothetical protein